MAKNDDSNGCSFGSVVITIVVVLGLKFLIFNVIPDLFKNKDKIMNEYKISNMEGDWKVFREEKYKGEILTCKTEGNSILFVQGNNSSEEGLKPFCNRDFVQSNSSQFKFYGRVANHVDEETGDESDFREVRLEFDEVNRITIYVKDEDGEWKNITSKLYLEKVED